MEALHYVPEDIGRAMAEKFKNGMSVGDMKLYPTFQLDEEEDGDTDIGPDQTLRAGEIPVDPK